MRRGFRTLAMLFAVSAAICPATAEVDLSFTDLRLPSDGTGSPDGTLAVRLTYPTSVADSRYLDGAPVVIYLPGGFGAGSLAAGAALARQGFVVVTFVFPGGRDGSTSSDGVYDYRGDACQRALRDVTLFAQGEKADSLGRTIDLVVPGPVLASVVGFAPYSNGLIGLVTLSRYADEIPSPPYQCGWENPTSGQIIAGDLGTRPKDCDPSVDTNGNGIPGDDGDNPWYDPTTGYGPTTFALDWSRLAFDPVPLRTYTDPAGRCPPVSRAGIVFHDGRANGRLDFSPSDPDCLDFDGDGTIERTEDFQLGGIITFSASCAPKVYYSREVTNALADRSIFPGAWPAWIATPAEADPYWDLREATVHWAALVARFPDLRLMTTFTKQDHVQSQSDHPHVRQLHDGTALSGFWYRLNADASYFLDANGALPAGYVETPAGAQVPLGQMKSRAEPLDIAADAMQAAGNAEMADRTYTGCWWPNLDGTLRPSVVPEAEAVGLTFGPDRIHLTWTPSRGAFCYDVLRGTSLADDGLAVRIEGGHCVADDASETVAADPAVPPPGGVFYYVVKPNGIHGRYGAGSSARPRTDPDRACR